MKDATDTLEQAAPIVLTVDEAAQLLRVNKKTLYSMVRRGKITGCWRKVGRTIRFHRDAVLRWLSCQTPDSQQ